MSTIVQARILSLDSSLLIKWWQEWENGEKIAKILLEKIAESEFWLLFTLHHVSELLANESDLVADSRARFVGQLGHVFWTGTDESKSIGDCLDIVSAELSAWMRLSDVPFSRLIAEAREEVIQFGSSTNLVDLMQDNMIRNEAREEAKRKRIRQSLIHATHFPDDVLSTSLVPRETIDSLEKVLKRFDRLELALSNQLSVSGDRRLECPADSAKKFYDKLRASAQKVAINGKVCLADMLADSGIPELDIEGQHSANKLGASEVWRRRREIIAEKAGIPTEQIKDLREDMLPSLSLMQGITTRQRRATRAEGGNFSDSALACLSLYADVTSVDKRTFEFIRQIKSSNSKLSPLLKTVTRWSNSQHVLKDLKKS